MDFTPGARRARLVARHHLAGDAADPVQAATDLLAVHATDPATVYLSLLARCADLSLSDIAHVLYDERTLVRMMAMRRTLFVVPMSLVPLVHHAASVDVAATMRKRLLAQLAALPTEPELPEAPGDLADWLLDVERGVEASIDARGTALASQLSTDEPRLRTSILPTTDKAWDVKRNITSQVLVMMAAEGRLVRASPRGSWLSRQHTWESAERWWWPDGISPVAEPKAALVEHYLRRFGPASVTDIQWWTGWSVGVVRKALALVETVDVGCGLVLADDTEPGEPVPASAALLPALDATPMGWKERAWFLPDDWQPLYDRNGNIGPTVWWDGEIVGGWSVRPDGTIVTALLADRGKAATRAVAAAVDQLQPRLEGAAVVPSFPTPLDRTLRSAG